MSDHETERLRRLLHECAPEVPAHDDLAGSARARAHRIQRNRRVGVAGITVTALVVVGVPVGLHLTPTNDTARIAGPGPVTKCHATKPLPKAQLPEMLAFLGGNWFGSDDLWVNLSQEGVSPVNPTLQFDTFTLSKKGSTGGAADPPTLTGQRLDGAGSATGRVLNPAKGANFDVPGGAMHLWRARIALPETGCWQLTAKGKDTTVTFVLDVARLQRESSGEPVPALLVPQKAADRLPRAVRKGDKSLLPDSSRLLGKSRYGRHWVAVNVDGNICLVTQLAAREQDGHRSSALSGASCATRQALRHRGVSLSLDGQSADGVVAYLLPPDVEKSSAQRVVDQLNQDPKAGAELLERDRSLLLVHSVGADTHGITLSRRGGKPALELDALHP